MKKGTWIVFLGIALVMGGLVIGEAQEQATADYLVEALTPDQLNRFVAGDDPASIVLGDGVTLADVLGPSAIATAPDSVFHPIPTCVVVETKSAVGEFAADDERSYLIRGPSADFSAQGGSATGCGVPTDATAVVINVNYFAQSSKSSRVRVWATGEPYRGPAVLNVSTARPINNMLVVPMGSPGSDFSVHVTQRGHIRVHTVGYFSPAVGGGDTLASLSCADGEIAKYSDPPGEWACADDEAGGGVTDIWVDEAGDTMNGPLQMFASHVNLNNTYMKSTFGPVDIRQDGTAVLHNRGTINPAGGNLGVGLGAHPSGSGWWNTAVGFKALENNTDGSSNLAVGVYALQNNTTGFGNTAIGDRAMRSSETSTWNLAIGFNAFANGGNYDYYGTGTDLATENIAIGESAMAFANSPTYLALRRNIAIGRWAMWYAEGRDNIGLGGEVLKNNTGNHNIALGAKALYNDTMGSDNVVIGHYAGNQSGEFGSYNVLIGAGAGKNGGAGDNHIAIGRYAALKGAAYGGTANNQIVLGNSQAESTFIHGIEATAPATDVLWGPMVVTTSDQVQYVDCPSGQVLKRQPPGPGPRWDCAPSGIEPGADGNVTLGDGGDYITINDVLQLTPRTARPVSCSAFRAGSLYAHDTGNGVIPCFCDGTTGFWKSLFDGANCPV